MTARIVELEELLAEAVCYDWEPECPPKELRERIDKALAGRKEERDMLHTTFNLLRENGACPEGYRKLAKSLGGVRKYGADTPIPLLRVLESNGLDDALWCLRAVLPEEKSACDRIARLFACRCVRETPLADGRVVWDLMTDERSRAAVVVAERYAIGCATEDELEAARDAAWEATWGAAMDVAWEAAMDVAWGAAWGAAREAARGAAREAAWEAAREAQAEFLKQALAGRKEER